MTPRKARWLLVCAAILVAGAFAVAVRFPPGRDFDPDAWRQREQAQDHAAAGMADRLVADSTLRGMTRDEIVRMLGEPPRTSYFEDWDMVYRLGPERGYLGIDSEWLVIRLDAGKRVIEYGIVRD